MSIGAPQYADKNVETLTGTKTFVVGDAYHQVLDPDGNRVVVMPDSLTTQGGRCMITNEASTTETITVQQSDASTTVAVIDQNESAEFVCNGGPTTTGWQAVGITEA